MKKVMILVCSLSIGCTLALMGIHAEDVPNSNLGPNTSDIDVNNFSNLGIVGDNTIEESGEIVKVMIDNTSYIEMDRVYVEDDMSIQTIDISTRDTGEAVVGIFSPKTITVTKSVANFPTTTDYSEYNNTAKAWYNGILTLHKIVNKNGKFIGTYSGFLIIQNW